MAKRERQKSRRPRHLRTATLRRQDRASDSKGTVRNADTFVILTEPTDSEALADKYAADSTSEADQSYVCLLKPSLFDFLGRRTQGFARAKRLISQSRRDYERACKTFDSEREESRDVLQQLERVQRRVLETTLPRFVALWESLGHQATVSCKNHGDSLEMQPDSYTKYEGVRLSVGEVVKTLGSSATAGIGAGTGATTLVTMFGAASTGTAISGLSGAAAQSALLAWFGGGALAAGGGGMAAGVVVLSGIFTIPAALVVAFKFAEKSEEALTKAEAIQASVDVAIAKMRTKLVYLQATQLRAGELQTITERLDKELAAVLSSCENQISAGTAESEDVLKAAVLATTLSKTLSARVIEDDLSAQDEQDALA